MRISDWISDVCSSDLRAGGVRVDCETVLAAGDLEQDPAGRDRTDHLRHDVGHHVLEREAVAGPQAEGHRRVEVRAGDMPERIHAGQHGQAEGQCHAHVADAELVSVGPDHVRGQYRRSAASQRSEEHTSELQSLMRISYAVFSLKKKTPYDTPN